MFCCNVDPHVTSNMFQTSLANRYLSRQLSMLSKNINFCEFVRYTWLSTDEQKPLFDTFFLEIQHGSCLVRQLTLGGSEMEGFWAWLDRCRRLKLFTAPVGRQKANPNCQAACMQYILCGDTCTAAYLFVHLPLMLGDMGAPRWLLPGTPEAMELPSYEDLGEATDLSAVEVVWRAWAAG